MPLMKKLSRTVLVLLFVSGAVDFSGLAFGLFYEGFFFDNFAHFLTSMALVSLATELAHWYSNISFGSVWRTLLAGALLGLVGGGLWEIFEVFVDYFVPGVYNPPVDTLLDMTFGTLGGAAGAWRTQAYLAPTAKHRRPL